MKRVLNTFSVGFLSLLLTGCGAAAITAIAASSGGSSSGGARPNTAPTIEVLDSSVPAVVTGNLVLAFTVTDGEGDSVAVTTQISADNGQNFRDVPDSAIVSGANVGLAGSAGGVQFSFTINTTDPALFPGQTVAQAIVRLSCTDAGGLASPTDDSIVFRIANNNPPVLSLLNNNDDVKEVALTFNVSDAEALINTPAFPARSETLSTGTMGEISISALTALAQSSTMGTPGTLLIRYDNGSVLVDQDNGDGTGVIQALSGPGFTNGTTASVNYATGVFSGDATITVLGNTVAGNAVSVDYNRSYLVVRRLQYDNLRDPDGFLDCTPSNGDQRVPFPVFVTRANSAQTFVWDSLTDLDFGNSQFVQLQLELDDGDNTVSATGNSFLINNGPLGENTQLPGLGQSDELKLGDFDGDGFVDAMIVHSSAPTSGFTVFYNNGQTYESGNLFSLPVPMVNGNPVFDSNSFGSRPLGGIDPNHIALMDVNQDNILDLIISNGADFTPESPGPDVSAQFIVYFGTGSRAQPFNLTNFWGPLRTGGFGVEELVIGDANSDGLDDLIIVNEFSHSPNSTSTRSAVLTRNTPTPDDLNTGDGNMYVLADANPANGQSLTNGTVIPGTIQIVFNNGGNIEGALGDTAILGNTLGVVVDAATQNPVSYVIYSNGLFIRDPRNVGLPAPLGPLGGVTEFNVTTGVVPTAAYDFGTPITASSLIRDSTFIDTAPMTGETFQITIQGFGPRGLSNATTDRGGNPLTEMVDINGVTVPLPSVKVNKTAALFPIFDDTFSFTDTTTFGDLAARIQALYEVERVNPLTEDINVVIDNGFIRVQLVKKTPGPDNNITPGVQLVVPMEVQLSDNVNPTNPNVWPLFEDSHGRISIYHQHPDGGFQAPNITQELPGANPTASFFPAAIPSPGGNIAVPATSAARLRMIPAGFNPNSTDKSVTAPGLGEAGQLYALVDALQGIVVYPPVTSTAAANVLSVASPVTPPAHLQASTPAIAPPQGVVPQYTGGFHPRDLAIGPVIPTSPTDTANDLIVACAGDGIYISMPKITVNALLAADPSPTNPLILYFGMFDYLDGLFATQELDVAGLINSNILRAGGSSGFFIQPDGTETRTVKLKFVNNDPLLDIVATAGNFTISAINQFGATPIPNPPFSVQIAVAGLLPGFPDVGDVNNDNLQDILVPLGASKEVAVLLQTPVLTKTLMVSNNTLVLDGILLDGFDSTRAVLSGTSIRIPFTSNSNAMELRSVTTVSGTAFQLFENGVRSPTSAAFGTVNPLTGAITGTLMGVTVDEATLTASYSQIFQNNFTQNAALENFKLVKFPTGFIPFSTIAQDINQDGLTDVVTLDGQSNNLSFRFQQPDVAFDNFINVPTGITPFLLEKGDVLSGNDMTEVIVLNSGSSTVGIYQPDPIQGLILIQEVSLSVAAGLPVPLIPFGIKVRDFNNDGVVDLMISVSAVGGADQISIPNQPEPFGGGFVIIPGLTQAARDGGATYAAAVIGLGYTNTLGSEVLDINNDGLLDVMLCNNGGGFVNGAVSYYINQGVPNLLDPNNEILTTFANFGNVPNPAFNPSMPVSPTNLKILPICVPLETPTAIFNNADALIGNFVNPGTRNYFTAQFNPTEAKSADLNGDGFLDLIASVGSPRGLGFPSIAIYKGKDFADNSDGLSANQPFFIDPTNTNASRIAYTPSYINIAAISPSASVDSSPVDFNEDGRIDIVVGDLTAAASAGIMFNRIDHGNPGNAPIFSDADFFNIALVAVNQPSGFAIGDISGDGKPDILLADQQRGLVSIYVNRLTDANRATFNPDSPEGRANLPNLFSRPILVQAGPNALDCLVLDLNGDGKQDLLVSSGGSNTVNVFFAR